MKLSSTTKYQRDKLWPVHSPTPESFCRDKCIILNNVVNYNDSKATDLESDIIAGAEGLDFWNICVPEGAPAHLRCDECANAFAVVVCDECCKVLCASCAEQIHLTSQGSNYHPHIQSLAIRRLRSGDTSHIHHNPNNEMQYECEDAYLGEDELAQMSDLSRPSVLEAPGITTLTQQKNTMPWNRLNSSFADGDIVIIPVGCLDAVPRHPDAYLQAPKPELFCDNVEEVYAEIQDTVEERHGIQDSDRILRVRVLAYVTRNYIEASVLKRLVKERGVSLARGAAADMRINSNSSDSGMKQFESITGNDEKVTKRLNAGFGRCQGTHSALNIVGSVDFLSSVHASQVESLSAKIMWQKERKANALNDMVTLLDRTICLNQQYHFFGGGITQLHGPVSE